MSCTKTAVVLGKDAKVEDILSLHIQPGFHDEQHLQQLFNLVTHARKAVAGMIDEALAAGFRQLRSMAREQVAALPDLAPYVAPTAAHASTRRQA
jgi:hypothetical protein